MLERLNPSVRSRAGSGAPWVCARQVLARLAPAGLALAGGGLAGLVLTDAARAQPGAPATDPAPASERIAVHGQLTYVEQDTASFDAPYAGRNSLSPSRGAETTDATLYVGARLWPG